MQKDCFFVADYQHVSLIEYPGKISSIVFTHGCNLRCRYCHNPSLVRGQRGNNRLFDFLEYLNGKEIEAVAVTGGEPLLSVGLVGFLEEMKSRGLSVKLDTNGFNPKRLEEVCRNGLVDYAAVDLKSFSDSSLKSLVRVDASIESFYDSLDVLNEYGVSFEIRHTLWEMPVERDIVRFVDRTGQRTLYVQKIRSAKMLDKTFSPPILQEDTVISLFEQHGIKPVLR